MISYGNHHGDDKTICFHMEIAMGMSKTICFHRECAMGMPKTICFRKEIVMGKPESVLKKMFGLSERGRSASLRALVDATCIPVFGIAMAISI